MPHTKTIMIVEDDEAVRRMALTALAAYGYGEVLEAENAAEALEISAKHPKPIHLLLSDITMPGSLDGCDLARKFNEERPDTKVLLMSGYIENTDCVQEGWWFIRKPFLISTLMESVHDVLNQP